MWLLELGDSFLSLDLRGTDLCLEETMVDLDGLVSSGRAGGFALLVNIEGLSECSASRVAEAGKVTVVPSEALGIGGTGSEEIPGPGAFAEAFAAILEEFSMLVDIEALKVSVILSNFLFMASPSLSSNWLMSRPEFGIGVEGVGLGAGSCP